MVRTELLLSEPISVAERVVRCAILLAIAETNGDNVFYHFELHSWFGMKMMVSLWWGSLLCTVLGLMIDFLVGT
jgi:hypothetical protein